MKIVTFLFLFLFGLNSFGQSKVTTKVAKLGYVSSMFAQIYSGADRYMEIYTTLECGHPLKVLARVEGNKEEIIFGKGWYLVKAGGYEGFIPSRFVSDTKVTECFNMQYPKYFDSLNLTISEMYYWGRLKSLYSYGESNAVGDGL